MAKNRISRVSKAQNRPSTIFTWLTAGILALLAAAQASAAPIKVTGEDCPASYEHVSAQEAQNQQDTICSILDPWDIARLAGGGSMDGSGYGCTIRSNDTRTLGASLCIAEELTMHEIGEYGSVEATHGILWQTVSLRRHYQDPVVFAQLVTHNGFNPSHVRIANVTASSFDFKIEEWVPEWALPTGPRRAAETVSYLVVEKGAYLMTDGTTLEVGARVVDADFQRVRLSGTYLESPLILTQSQTFNGSDPIVTRQRLAGPRTFEVMLQEAENSDGWHAPELVGYLAMEQKAGETDQGTRYRAKILPQSVTDAETHLQFTEPFAAGYSAILAAIQTTVGLDTVAVRFRWSSYPGDDAWLFLEEEQTLDEETGHWPEQVGFLKVSGQGLLHATGTPVNGWNVNLVEHHLGSFQNTGDVWVEKNSDGMVEFVFDETHRDEWSVYLYDSSRGIHLQLDLWLGEVLFRWDSQPNMQSLYRITSRSNALLKTPNPEFISVVGGYLQVTAEEIIQNYAMKGLELGSFSSLGPGQCTIVYPNATRQHVDQTLYLHDNSVSIGTLTCALELADGVMLTQTLVYGGCNLTDFTGGGCEVGVAATELEFQGPVTSTITVNGPRAAACANVSPSSACVETEASLVGTSISSSSNGYGIGIGLSLSVGIDGKARFEEGVLTGEVGLGLGIGLSISLSLNLNPFVAIGETAFVTTGEGAIVAGEAVVDAYEEIEEGIDEAVAASLDGVALAATEFLAGLEIGAETSVGSLFSAAKDAGGAFIDFAGDVGDFFVDVGGAFDFCFGIFC